MDSGDVGNVGLLIQATGEMGCLVSAGSTSRGAPRGAGEAGVGGSAHTAFPPPRGDTVTPHGVQVGAARAAGKRGWSRVGAARGRWKAWMVPSGGSEGPLQSEDGPEWGQRGPLQSEDGLCSL